MATIEDKLKFAAKNELNVMLIGHAGVGKTSIVKNIFEELGLKYLYYSASTMDPWVDFVGVPHEVTGEDGVKYLDLVRPKAFAYDDVEAIFLDEYNRCISGDTKILLADGTSEAVKDLVGREHFYVYSFDTKNKSIEIAKAHSARITVRNENLLKITLDNGASFKCTKDHPILRITGEFDLAENFSVNDSLMPCYRFWKQTGYEYIMQPQGKKWELTYLLADLYNLRNNIYKIDDGEHRHHVDFDKHNNSPENILRLTESAHMSLHANHDEKSIMGGRMAHKIHPDLYARTIGTEESRKKMKERSALVRKTCPKYKAKRSIASKKMYTQEMRDYRAEVTKKQWQTEQFKNIDRKASLERNHLSRVLNFLTDNNINIGELTEENYKNAYLERSRNKRRLPMKHSTIITKFSDFENFKKILLEFQSAKKNGNHKIIKIEEVDAEDTYDITVDEFENFALECGIFVHNSPIKVRNAVMELIQFKSINGKKFNNLKLVWAAINPSDEDDTGKTYDVEALDPAQLDRFHFHIEMPYALNKKYFKSKYPEYVDAVLEWWNALPKPQKNLVSPRRVDMALSVLRNGGDLNWILPNNVNCKELVDILDNGTFSARVGNCFEEKNEEKTKNLLTDNDKTLSKYMKCIFQKNEYIEYFMPFITDEQMMSMITNNNKPVIDYVSRADIAVTREKLLSSIVKAKSVKKDLLDKFNNVLKVIRQSKQKIDVTSNVAHLPSESLCIGKNENSHIDLESNRDWLDFYHRITSTRYVPNTYDRKKVFLALTDMGGAIYDYKMPEKTELIGNIFDCAVSIIKSTYNIVHGKENLIYLIKIMNSCDVILSEHNIDIFALMKKKTDRIDKALKVIEQEQSCYDMLNSKFKDYHDNL